MLFRIGGEIFDCQFSLMEDLLLTIEKKLSIINNLVKKSSDPVSDGYCDNGEYLIGAGFVLLQQKLKESLTLFNSYPKNHFKIGPRYSKDYYIAEVINNCANYWKHEPEWVGKKYNEFKGSNKNTRDSIVDHTTIALEKVLPQTNDNLKYENSEDALYLFTNSYPLSQIICNTNNNNECSFVGLLQHVKDWQKAIFEDYENCSTLGKENP